MLYTVLLPTPRNCPRQGRWRRSAQPRSKSNESTPYLCDVVSELHKHRGSADESDGFLMTIARCFRAGSQSITDIEVSIKAPLQSVLGLFSRFRRLPSSTQPSLPPRRAPFIRGRRRS